MRQVGNARSGMPVDWARRAATASAEEIARSNTNACKPADWSLPRPSWTPNGHVHVCHMLHVRKEGAYQRVERLVIVGVSCRPEMPAHNREQQSRSEHSGVVTAGGSQWTARPGRLVARTAVHGEEVRQPTTDYSGEGSRSRSSRPPRCWSLRRRPALCEPPQDRVALSSCAKKKAICEGWPRALSKAAGIDS